MVDRSPARRAPWYPDEEWADIPGFEGTYWISSYGRLLSRPRRKSKGGFMKHTAMGAVNNMYAGTGLALPGGRRVNVVIHRLVARVFIGPAPAGMEICHNDSDSLNPRLDNLRYDTHRNNIRESVAAGRWGAKLQHRRHCPHKHDYTEANTFYTSQGYQACRECRRLRNAGLTPGVDG